jgi:hypothetical protein
MVFVKLSGGSVILAAVVAPRFVEVFPAIISHIIVVAIALSIGETATLSRVINFIGMSIAGLVLLYFSEWTKRQSALMQWLLRRSGMPRPARSPRRRSLRLLLRARGACPADVHACATRTGARETAANAHAEESASSLARYESAIAYICHEVRGANARHHASHA